jgi:hypothetical protein
MNESGGRNYGMHIDHTGRLQFDLATNTASRYVSQIEC